MVDKIRQLPNDETIEQAVLSTLLFGDGDYSRIFGILDPEDFYTGDHSDLYKILHAVHSKGMKTDPVTIQAATKGRYALLIANLGALYVSDSLIGQHAEILKKLALERQTIIAFHSADYRKVKDLLSSEISLTKPAFFDPESVQKELFEYRERGSDPWTPSGWPELDNYFRIGSGQLTVVTGIPNSGKSNFMDALAVNLAKREDWRFIIYSPENLPVKRHIRSIIEKYSGFNFFDIDLESLAINYNWVKDHFVFIDPDSINRNLDSVLAGVNTVLESRKIQGVIIDPWNELEHSRPDHMSETEYVGAALMRIRSFAIKHDLHIWIVAHPTKLRMGEDGEYEIPNPYDIAGSANWRNKPDNCLTVYRYFGNGSVEVFVQKIRFKDFGRLGSVQFEYLPETGQYKQKHAQQ